MSSSSGTSSKGIRLRSREQLARRGPQPGLEDNNAHPLSPVSIGAARVMRKRVIQWIESGGAACKLGKCWSLCSHGREPASTTRAHQGGPPPLPPPLPLPLPEELPTPAARLSTEGSQCQHPPAMGDNPTHAAPGEVLTRLRCSQAGDDLRPLASWAP